MRQLTEKEIKHVKYKLERNSIKDPVTGCWLWQKHSNGGYGRFQYHEIKLLVHVWSAWIYKGIEPKTEILVCHTRNCSSKKCWNPDHLYAGTYQTNMNDQIAMKRHHLKEKTHCSKGHTLDSYFWDSTRCRIHRYCSICRTSRVREYRKKKQTSEHSRES